MKIFDIRRKDVVRFRAGLSDKDKKRISEFARNVSKQAGIRNYTVGVLDGRRRLTFKVQRIGNTQKKKTELAWLESSENILLPVQTRFLELVRRKPSHPLTDLFQDRDD